MSENPSVLNRLWEDLKRRHVVRVAIGYAIVAWALVQGADILLPTFDAPEWLFRAIVAVAFLGFPVTIILAWVFDISDKHVVVTDDTGFRLPKWVKSVLALPLIALVGASGWWVWSGYVAEKESSVRPTDLSDQVPIVAVVPIRNITGNPDLDWYSEGLANLIRDNLTRSKYLRVVSSQKWQSIIGETTDAVEISELGQEEGIGFILSGEMLITPDGISITSRLTDTEGGVSLSARQVEKLTTETLLTAAGPIATQVKQGLNVPREEQVDIFAADFATNNLSAYESYVAGLGFFLKFQYEQAAQAFNAALQLAPDFAVARYRLAYIQASQGNREMAITNVESALNAPFLADREKRYIQATLAYLKQEYDVAAEQFEALLAGYPFEVEAREWLAKTYWAQYREAEAIVEMERLAAEEPQNQVIWSLLGFYHLQMGEFDKAQPALRRYAQLAPDNANSFTLLGDSLRFQGDFEGAVKLYDKALEIDPEMRSVATSLATIEYLEGDYQSASEQFSRIALDTGNAVQDRLNAMFPMVYLLAARGSFKQAVMTLERFSEELREEQIREAMATAILALYQLEMGREAPARELADSAIRLAPGVPTRYLFARGLIELRTGQYDQVVSTAREIAGHALPPENPDRTEEKAAAYLTGMALLARNRLDEARADLQRAIALDGYAYKIYELGLARLMMLQGETNAALQIVSEAIRPDLVDPRFEFELERTMSVLLSAEIQRKAGNLAAAARLARDFLARFDQSEPTHQAVILALEIAGEASMAELSGTKKGGLLAAL